MGNKFSSETSAGNLTGIPSETPDEVPHSTGEDLSQRRLQILLQQGPPYPQIVLPSEGGYWQEEEYNTNNQAGGSCFNGEETDSDSDISTCYRDKFMGKEHWNFIGEDESLGPVVLSYKNDDQGLQRISCVLLRLSSSSTYRIINQEDGVTPATLVTAIRNDLTLQRLDPVVTPFSSSLLLGFDEHALRQSFKFGIIYQCVGQTNEDQLFSNENSSPAMEQFLNYCGQRVQLTEHQGFLGGLKTQGTGKESVYEIFRKKEIMFHVSTLLPFDENDCQQIDRKRHIGNDIVAVVFQEGNTPFTPDMISSHFFHAFIVVHPIDPCTDKTRYSVSVVAREGVPHFGPPLPPTGQFITGPNLKEYLLNKLINAHLACLKAPKFASLEQRTRHSLICNLVEDLRQSTKSFLGFSVPKEVPKSEHKSTRFIDIVRLIMEKRRKEKQNENPREWPKIRTSSKSEYRSTSRNSRSNKYSAKSIQDPKDQEALSNNISNNNSPTDMQSAAYLHENESPSICRPLTLSSGSKCAFKAISMDDINHSNNYEYVSSTKDSGQFVNQFSQTLFHSESDSVFLASTPNTSDSNFNVNLADNIDILKDIHNLEAVQIHTLGIASKNNESCFNSMDFTSDQTTLNGELDFGEASLDYSKIGAVLLDKLNSATVRVDHLNPETNSVIHLNHETSIKDPLDYHAALPKHLDTRTDSDSKATVIALCEPKQFNDIDKQPSLQENPSCGIISQSHTGKDFSLLTSLETGLSSFTSSENGMSSLSQSDAGLGSLSYSESGMDSFSSANEMSQLVPQKTICLYCVKCEVKTCRMHLDHRNGLEEISKLNEEVKELKIIKSELTRENKDYIEELEVLKNNQLYVLENLNSSQKEIINLKKLLSQLGYNTTHNNS